MDSIRKKVNEEIESGWIGQNKGCEYHPCHFKGQDCTFCYCPFFPCGDEKFGHNIETRHGDVWDCSECLFIHRTDVAKFTCSEIERLGIKDASDPRFKDIFEEAKKKFWKPGKAIMVVGATSDAGKTTFVSALCRMLSRRGFIVAPFKSQNMSLNSKVAMDGSEIAIAQVLQAKAAGLTNPDYHMNPILLKPKGDSLSQVIVRGKPYRDFYARAFYKDFVPKEGWKVVKEEIGFLKDRYDYVVLEGAGSPSEVNMVTLDIANMRAADAADADVILVVNVTWGGSFAYALGTLECMPEKDKARVKGVILNNLMGEKENYMPGVKELEERTGIPVIGLVPHAELALPNEDSESLRGVHTKGSGKAVIAVIRFPRISNFTDLDPLLQEDVSIVYVEKPEDLVGADAIVIPGTKNTITDYLWMSDSGIADAVKAMRGKVPILGICGGYQMMGRSVEDPVGLQSGLLGKYETLGFFDNTTTIAFDSSASKNECTMLVGDGSTVSGYEVHVGVSDVNEKPLFKIERIGKEPREEGSVREDEMLFGTYQHGIFDKPAFRKYFLSFVKHNGEPVELGEIRDYDEVVDENLDKLADLFESNLDMDILCRILDLRE